MNPTVEYPNEVRFRIKEPGSWLQSKRSNVRGRILKLCAE